MFNDLVERRLKERMRFHKTIASRFEVIMKQCFDLQDKRLAVLFIIGLEALLEIAVGMVAIF